MNKIDVTDKFDFGDNDGEYLPIRKCICGMNFNYWEFFIKTYYDSPKECPNCKRKFCFLNEIKIYEIVDE